LLFNDFQAILWVGDSLMVDEITRATMIATLARWQTAWTNQQAQNAIRDQAAKRAYEFSRIVDECKATAKSLGFDRDDKEAWSKTTAEFYGPAAELYARAKSPDMPEWNPTPKNEPEIDADMQDKDGETEQEVAGRPSIRTIALERLEGAGPAGLKAADIRKFIEDTYSIETHEKTVGMTLYRLLKDELVRREGHIWFLVPHHGAGTKNPGGETPGPNNVFS
jgi:hypothetical protein